MKINVLILEIKVTILEREDLFLPSPKRLFILDTILYSLLLGFISLELVTLFEGLFVVIEILLSSHI